LFDDSIYIKIITMNYTSIEHNIKNTMLIY
jgi:hypothetical protein